jgi:hypothetical protein
MRLYHRACRLYARDATVHGVLCDAQGVDHVCTWWRALHTVCRVMDVQVVQRATYVRDVAPSVLLQVHYTARILGFAPVDMHLHVVLTMGVSGHVVQHEEQLLLDKMAAQVPVVGRLWWWIVHVVAPLLLHTLWLPILRMAVAESKPKQA